MPSAARTGGAQSVVFLILHVPDWTPKQRVTLFAVTPVLFVASWYAEPLAAEADDGTTLIALQEPPVAQTVPDAA